jgi:hypothetical protein
MQCIFTLTVLSPLREGLSPLFEYDWIPFTQGWFVLSLIKFGLLVFDKNIFKDFQCIFTFAIISPWRRVVPYVWANLNSLHPSIFCIKFDWICLGWFWRRRFLKIFSVFSLFRYYLSLEKGYPLRLNKLEFPLPKNDLCKVWLKFTQWFWRRFLNDPSPFWHFCDYLLFEEDLALYLNKLESSLPKDNLYQVWLNLACWFWGRKF